jgi:hypothetical protein
MIEHRAIPLTGTSPNRSCGNTSLGECPSSWLDATVCRYRFPSVRSIRLARWSTGPRCGLTDEFSAPCWSVRRIPTHGRLTPCGN